MRTTHGVHISGTRFGRNPPLEPPRCGGLNQCPDCRLEAATVTGCIDYFREETFDASTYILVINSLCEAGLDEEMARIAVQAMESRGILFRERKLR